MWGISYDDRIWMLLSRMEYHRIEILLSSGGWRERYYRNVFSRMRREGFPFIGGGLGVGPVFASRCSCRRDRRRDRRVNSVPMGKVATGVLLSCLCFSSGVAVTMVEAAKRVVFDRVKVSKLEEVSHEMLVLTCLCASFVVHSSTGTSFVRAL